MTVEQTTAVAALALGGIAVAIVVFMFIAINREGYLNNKSPIVEVYAVVNSMEVVTTGTSKNIYGSPSNMKSLQVTFYTGNDLIVTLLVPESQYTKVQEGAKGMLTYQRKKFVSFVPEENTNKGEG